MQHQGLVKALYQMIVGWGTVAIVYFSIGWRATQPVFIPELWLDHQLSFSPHAIWLYLSFFLLVPYTFLHTQSERLLRLRYAMQISAIFSGIFFLLLPSQLNYPAISGAGLSVDLLRALTSIDSHQNCLPSLHAALTTICVMVLYRKQQLLKSVFFIILGIAIGVSIIKLRRHLTIDVSAGIAVGIASYYLAIILENKIPFRN